MSAPTRKAPHRMSRPGDLRFASRALALLLCAAAPLAAAEFGNGRNAPPPGYFVLVSENAIQAGGLAWALGDIPHRMTFYIEVTAPNDRLTIEIYDPGLYDPAGGLGDQLDSTFSTSGDVGEMYFALIGPDLSLVQPATTYRADTNPTNRRLVTLFDSPVPAGTYQLYVELLDMPGDDQDLSVFGIRVPGRHVYTYNLSAGHNNMDGASIIDPIALYPYLDGASAGAAGPIPVCGLDFVNYDMDAAVHGVEPPAMSLTTRRGGTFTTNPPHPSANMSFWVDSIAEIPFGELDSDDQGIWTWKFTQVGAIQDQVSPSLPAPFDTNAFSIQVYDYGQNSPMWNEWPFEPSFLNPLDDRHTRRIYLPGDAGAAPVKEFMGHSARVIAGQDPVTATFTSTIETTFTFVNPREYDIAVTNGTTYVSPSPEISNPVLTNPGTNLRAAINGADPKRIDLSGTVPAGATETFTYTVDITPATAGARLLNGDGADFIGGGRATVVRYRTPATLIYGDEQWGPVCSMYVVARQPVCTAHAEVIPSATEVCAGERVDFDGSGSWVNLCIGGTIEYQWLVNGGVWQAYPAPGQVGGAPPASATVTLQVRCSSDPACTDSVDVPITVFPAPAPVILPPDPDVCNAIPVTLTLSNAAAYVSWSWSTTPPGLPGDGATTPSVQASDIGAVYTVSATTADGCAVESAVTIRERILDPPVIVPADPTICPSGAPVTIAAQGTWTLCEWRTNPAGADGDGSTGCSVDTNDPGVQYTVTVHDADGCTAQASVTTVLATDTVPPALGPVLRVRKEGRDDVRIQWTDLPQTMGEYRIPRLDGDSDGNGSYDTFPTLPNILAAPWFTQAPGIGSYVEAGGQHTSSWLVFYRVRAASACFLTPGPP